MNRLKELENPGVYQLQVRLKLGPKGRHLFPSSPSSASPERRWCPAAAGPLCPPRHPQQRERRTCLPRDPNECLARDSLASLGQVGAPRPEDSAALTPLEGWEGVVGHQRKTREQLPGKGCVATQHSCGWLCSPPAGWGCWEARWLVSTAKTTITQALGGQAPGAGPSPFS